jgi:hypothetical protein
MLRSINQRLLQNCFVFWGVGYEFSDIVYLLWIDSKRSLLSPLRGLGNS